MDEISYVETVKSFEVVEDFYGIDDTLIKNEHVENHGENEIDYGFDNYDVNEEENVCEENMNQEVKIKDEPVVVSRVPNYIKDNEEENVCEENMNQEVKIKDEPVVDSRVPNYIKDNEEEEKIKEEPVYQQPNKQSNENVFEKIINSKPNDSEEVKLRKQKTNDKVVKKVIKKKKEADEEETYTYKNYEAATKWLEEQLSNPGVERPIEDQIWCIPQVKDKIYEKVKTDLMNKETLNNKSIFDDMEGEEPNPDSENEQDDNSCRPCSPSRSYYENEAILNTSKSKEDKKLVKIDDTIKTKSTSSIFDEPDKENVEKNLEFSNIGKKARRGRPLKINQ